MSSDIRRPKETVGLRLDINPDYHHRARFASVASNESLTAYVRRVVQEAIDRDWPAQQPAPGPAKSGPKKKSAKNPG